jgi:hypothetical protein
MSDLPNPIFQSMTLTSPLAFAYGGTGSTAEIAAGLVSSNGTGFETTTVVGGTWGNGTLTISAISAPSAGLTSSNGTTLESTTIQGGASWGSGTLTAAAAPAASLVSSNGTILEDTTIVGGEWSNGTLTILGTPPAAGIVSSNGTTFEATTLAGASWNSGTLTVDNQGSGITSGVVSTNGTVFESTTLVGATFASGTLTISNQVTIPAAGLVSSNGTVLEDTTLVGATWNNGTLTIAEVGVPAAGLVSSNGTVFEATTVVGALSWSNGTLTNSGVSSIGGISGAAVLGANLSASGQTISVSGLGSMASQAAGSVAITGGTITGINTPVNPTDVTIKSYVDAAIVGIDFKPTAIVATTAALATNTYITGTITLVGTGPTTIDGHVLILNDTVLVKNEGTAAHNGLYNVTTAGTTGVATILIRNAAMNQSSELAGAFVPVSNIGTVNANSLWLANPTTPATIDVTAIPFTELNGATDLTPGFNVGISGNVINAATGITAGLVSTNGTLLEATTLTGAVWTSGTLTITNQGSGITAGLISTNGTIFEATTIVGGTWNAGTLTVTGTSNAFLLAMAALSTNPELGAL